MHKTLASPLRGRRLQEGWVAAPVPRQPPASWWGGRVLRGFGFRFWAHVFIQPPPTKPLLCVGPLETLGLQ